MYILEDISKYNILFYDYGIIRYNGIGHIKEISFLHPPKLNDVLLLTNIPKNEFLLPTTIKNSSSFYCRIDTKFAYVEKTKHNEMKIKLLSTDIVDVIVSDIELL